MTGSYVLMAIQAAFSKDGKYPTTPIDMREKTEEEKQAELKAKILATVEVINARIKAKQEGE